MRLNSEIAEFTNACHSNLPKTPIKLTPEAVAFITKMVNDELKELAESETPTEQADALVDAIYYICDTATRHGFNLDPYLDIVHKANMQKVVDGKVIRRGDGKIMKPACWVDPAPLLIAETKRQELLGKVDLAKIDNYFHKFAREKLGSVFKILNSFGLNSYVLGDTFQQLLQYLVIEGKSLRTINGHWICPEQINIVVGVGDKSLVDYLPWANEKEFSFIDDGVRIVITTIPFRTHEDCLLELKSNPVVFRLNSDDGTKSLVTIDWENIESFLSV